MLIKASIAAMGALVAVALILPGSFSASGAQAACEIRCGSSSTTSSTPPDDGGPGGPGGDGGDLPTPPPEEKIRQLEETCNGALQDLVKIPEKMVLEFDNPSGVTVAPVCNSGLGHQAKIDASQALPLQDAIAANPVLMGVLKAHGFHAEDVVGVVLIKGVATLYVHKNA